MPVGFANSGCFRVSKFEILFNHGEGILKKCQRVLLILDDIRVSKFKIIINYGERIPRKCQLLSLILDDLEYQTSIFFQPW